MSGGLRVGVAQWTPERDPGASLRTAQAAVRELARRGARLAVLPELWLCGYRGASLAADARAAAEPIDGPVQRRLAALASETGLVLCAGSFPERDGGQLFNTAVVYGPAGDLLLRHRKAHLYGAEPEVFRPGDDAVTAGDIAGIGRVGLCVCFDGDFPETARALRAAGADLVLHPSAYEAAVASWWDTIYPAHALCNSQWWISANQHGGTAGDRMLGGSRVIAPDGRTVAAAPRHREAVPAPELLVVDIALDDELATAAETAGMLWPAPAQTPALRSPLPPRRTEAIS
ncbi:MAG: carbon-nitrogen hydrolase family protein [Streptosporangiaceae bacterium]